MKILYFEPFSGASGDMILGAFIDLGIDFENIKCFLEGKLKIRINTRKVLKNGINATKVDVIDKENKNNKTYIELIELIKSFNLDPNVENDALSILKIIGAAESKIHSQCMDLLHFHEIGQNDAIVDIVGSCLLIKEIKDSYGISFDSVVCDTINIGGGFLECIHGKYPLPAPSTLEILKNSKLYYYETENSNNYELLTPTGAALLSYFTSRTKINISSYKRLNKKTISIGYGSGNIDKKDSNVLRVSICELQNEFESKKYDNKILNNIDHIEILETNIDNCTGEILGLLINKVLSYGAKDAYLIPIVMKKGRPGYLLKVLVEERNSFQIAKQIMIETGSLGIRVIETKHRIIANRIFKNYIYIYNTKKYLIPIKISYLNDGSIINITPEFDTCKTISESINYPIKNVLSEIQFQVMKKYCNFNSIDK